MLLTIQDRQLGLWVLDGHTAGWGTGEDPGRFTEGKLGQTEPEKISTSTTTCPRPHMELVRQTRGSGLLRLGPAPAGITGCSSALTEHARDLGLGQEGDCHCPDRTSPLILLYRHLFMSQQQSESLLAFLS